MDAQERVKQFIVENFYVSDPSALTPETSLIAGDFVDSTGMLELIVFLEREFGIQVKDTEMSPENLETLERIAAFVARKAQPAS